MNNRFKTIGIVLASIVFYYVLQFASSAIHYNCYILKDDCVPPINLASELVYNLIFQPPWLSGFDITPDIYVFSDGQFSFWQGEVNSRAMTIRVKSGDSPVFNWLESGLPSGVSIVPASEENIRQWLKNNPEIKPIR